MVGETMPSHFHHERLPLAEREDGHMVPRLTRRDFMLGGTVLLCCGCSTVPITGRSQLMLVSQAEETALGAQAYREVLQKEPVTQDPRYTEPVQRIARRLEGCGKPPRPALGSECD